MPIKTEIEPRSVTRPAHAEPDYEARALDLAAEAMEDIRECDEATVYIKWDKLGGVVAPLLYILFDGTAPSLDKMPKVHLHPVTGALHPAHAVCLAVMPSGRLMTGQLVKDTVRRGVERFLRSHDVKPSFYERPPLVAVSPQEVIRADGPPADSAALLRPPPSRN